METSATRVISPPRTAHTRPPRIAYVFPWSVFGGGEIATLRLARAIHERSDYEATVWCLPDARGVSNGSREAALDTYAYAPPQFSYRHGARYAAQLISLARELRRRKIDLVHGADLMGGYYASLAGRLARIPVVCHVRSNFPHNDIPAHHKVPLFGIDRFLFCSHATWRNFNHIWRVGSDRGTVVYDWPPVENDPAPPADGDPVRAIRSGFGIPENVTVFTMMARVAPQKDFETLLAAFARIVQANPGVRLLLVGEYEHPRDCRQYWEQLSRIVDAEGLGGHVIWTGFRTDVTAILNASDAIVLCTHGEGLPLTVLEAMAAGRPVIATRVGGVPEAIVHGRTGLLHEHGDVAGLAGCMLQVMNDRPSANELGAHGKAFVASAFSEKQAVDEISAIYRKALVSSHRLKLGGQVPQAAVSGL